ncbi:unnamed protein product [Hyaloperonospora brassicae]|uniref:Uncharacterized protein n=1 Tax=Hyaloperonospora brassicae TaxID=162125 RepID=A0AAV0UIA6_HYABA|nr:unnamed protein product [Hyaloperonospora brassicae]
MIRSSAVLTLLAVIASASSTQAIDWTFWHDDDDSTDSVVEPGTLSPATLASMMGLDYMDRVKSMISSGHVSGSSDKSPAITAPSTDSSDSSDSSLSIDTPRPPRRSSKSTFANLAMPKESAIATPSTAVSTFRSTHRNWVGTWHQSADSACYREAHFMKTCPSNYDRSKLTDTCWSECPMEYPIECGMQCIQQNNDCGREDVAKISAVAMSTLSMATFGVFGGLAKMGKKVGWAVRCANMLMTATRAIIRFTRNQMVLDPQTSQEKLLLLLYQTNWVAADLPATIYACMGKTVPPTLQAARGLLPTMQYVLLLVLGYGDDIMSTWGKFKAFMTRANFTEAASKITKGEISSLETAMKSDATCSEDLRSALNLVWMTVNEYREKDPGISEADIRLKISQSDLILYDIPIITNNCMSRMISESTVDTAYKTRETLRKTFGVVVNDLIKDGKSDNGTSMAAKHNAYVLLDDALTMASVTGLEPTDLSTLASEFLQTICGPTQFMGEIDDGKDDATLGMNALKKAFKNTTSSWTRKGDGNVIINFTSKDTKDVTVNIRSGGDKVDEVGLRAGGTARWTSTVKELGGKTLYLDRWRPGFLGLPGTGGGSLVLWVPISRDGGHLEINAELNGN